MSYSLLVLISEMERIDLGKFSHNSSFFLLVSLPLKLSLLFCELLLNLEQRNFEEAIEALFVETRH